MMSLFTFSHARLFVCMWIIAFSLCGIGKSVSVFSTYCTVRGDYRIMDPAVTVIGRLRFLLLKEEIRVEFYYWRRSVLDVLLVRVVVGVLLYGGLLWFFFSGSVLWFASSIWSIVLHCDERSGYNRTNWRCPRRPHNASDCAIIELNRIIRIGWKYTFYSQFGCEFPLFSRRTQRWKSPLHEPIFCQAFNLIRPIGHLSFRGPFWKTNYPTEDHTAHTTTAARFSMCTRNQLLKCHVRLVINYKHQEWLRDSAQTNHTLFAQDPWPPRIRLYRRIIAAMHHNLCTIALLPQPPRSHKPRLAPFAQTG